jgi:hypothetical protein
VQFPVAQSRQLADGVSRTLPLGQTLGGFTEFKYYDDRSLADVDTAGGARSASTALGQLAWRQKGTSLIIDAGRQKGTSLIIDAGEQPQ